MRNINSLNEELARWAFEILFRSNSSWQIAFTNPTAGPWKTIKAFSKETGEEGEVYRFILEEERPDIIMYNDTLGDVIIIEAKDSLNKLQVQTQAEKSAAVVVKLATLLAEKGTNEFWRGREGYKIILGLLWGSTGCSESSHNREHLFDYYHELIAGEQTVYNDLIVGIETLYLNGNLQCEPFYKSYSTRCEEEGKELCQSLIPETR